MRKSKKKFKKFKNWGECNKEPIDIFKMGGNVNLKEPIGWNAM